MSDVEKAHFFMMAETRLDRLSTDLSKLATDINLKPFENDFQDRAFDILMDAYRERIEPLLESMQRERDFIDSGEAAVENESEVNRNWYLDIMRNSEFKDV